MAFIQHEIGVKDAVREYASSKLFMRRLISGRYIYVENCLCFYHSKYIKWDATVASLTDYAREHKDECCLSFSTFVTGSWACEQKPGTIGYVTQPTVSDPKYRDNPEMVHEQVEMFSAMAKPVLSLASKLSCNFPEMLNDLITSKGVTEEDLAETSNLSEKTIQRLRNHDPKNVSLETVLQLCIGLHLHPILSGRLLRAAGQRFMDTDTHNMYKFLLSTCYEYTVEDCNVLLKSQGYATLGRAKA